MRTIASFGIILLLGACAHARTTQVLEPPAVAVHKLPRTREEALQVLQNTDTFAHTAIGEGGAPSAGACAFSIVMGEPDAVDLFRGLLEGAHMAGQLYALSALYQLDRSRYDSEVPKYETSDAVVETMVGCIMSTRPVRELIHTPVGDMDIGSGFYPRLFTSFKGCTK